MWSYWCRVGKRAFADTLALFGWGNWTRIAVRTGSFLIAVFAASYFGATQIATGKAEWLFYALIGTGLLFVLVFVGYLVVTPHRLDCESRAENTSLTARLTTKAITEDGIHRLHAAFEEGVAIDRSKGMFGPNPYRAAEWVDETADLLDEIAPRHEALMFRTLPTDFDNPRIYGQPPLTKHLAKLRFIIGRMAKSIG